MFSQDSNIILRKEIREDKRETANSNGVTTRSVYCDESR